MGAGVVTGRDMALFKNLSVNGLALVPDIGVGPILFYEAFAGQPGLLVLGQLGRSRSTEPAKVGGQSTSRAKLLPGFYISCLGKAGGG